MTLRPPSSLEPLLTRPVAILGGGVSGEGVRALVERIGAQATVYDANAGRGAAFTAEVAREHRLVVYSPGFPPEHPWLAWAREAGAECWNELDFAAVFWTGEIVAITGTNGKTTLTEFITHALRSVGVEAYATGNVGYSFTKLVAEHGGGSVDAVAVCEVSSFQAETLQQLQPDATLWTNLAEDHLERHPGMEAYFAAKWRLVERTADVRGVFVGSSVAHYARKFGRSLVGVQVVASESAAADPALRETAFAEYPQRENFLLAAAWWESEGRPRAQLEAAARSFRLGRHRMTMLETIGSVTFWNDSKATNFHAVEAALSRFESPVVLIAGGKSKGGDLAGFVQRIAARVRHAVLIGETAAELAGHCASARVPHSRAATLEEAVRRALEVADDGGHVLLSPGFASFDMFRNYEDRGAQFERIVTQLAAAAPSLR